jgi:hypothetical protein
MNREELVSSMNQASSELLRQKGFISFVDVLIQMGKLTKEDHESWRMRRIPYLERAIRLNLSQLSLLLRTLRQNAVKGRLQPSKTAYVSWGKGPKQPLRFSKSGQPGIEQAYATHFVKHTKGRPSGPSPPNQQVAEATQDSGSACGQGSGPVGQNYTSSRITRPSELTRSGRPSGVRWEVAARFTSRQRLGDRTVEC